MTRRLKLERARLKQEARDHAVEQRTRADAFYQLRLMLNYGLGPWQDYMYLRRLRLKKALLHWRQTVRMWCVGMWRVV